MIFIKKLKNNDQIPHNTIMVTADVVSLYPSITHGADLKALRKLLDNRENKKISTDDLNKMVEFFLKKNCCEFIGEVKKQIPGTVIGTKFAPPYVIYGSKFTEVETEFLKIQKRKPLAWFRYIDDVFFIWTRAKEKLSFFFESLSKFYPNIKFSHEVNKESIHFLDLNVR